MLQGDCRDVLPTLEAGSVHTVVTSPPYYALRSYLDASHPDKHREIGSEATPDEYIQTMVAVFREVRRVLRDDGTCWVNMGDSYASTKVGNTNGVGSRSLGWKNEGSMRSAAAYAALVSEANAARQSVIPEGLKPKDLLMMPARLALELQADGWWLRSDIIWAKPNPMPESVTDRPTSAHEHVFLLTKAPRYYFDAEAIKETSVSDHPSGNGYKRDARLSYADANGARGNDEQWQMQPTRSPRNVWTIATHAYPEAHFATFPPELAERCIKAGTSERGCCAQCGAPWVRQVERTAMVIDRSERTHPFGRTRSSGTMLEPPTSTTTGWAPSCQCGSFRCVSCGFVLDTTHEAKETSTAQSVSDMRQAVPPVEAGKSLLQPSLLPSEAVTDSPAGMSSVRQRVSAKVKSATLLQFGLFNQMDGPEPQHGEGLDDNEQGLQAVIAAGPSERDGGRLRDGAPAGDGEEARPASDQGRGGPPQEWQSAGQPDQQLGTDGEASARRPSEAGLLCDVPALPADVSDARTCPHCGSHAKWTVAATAPCVVLDVFGGAGTTGLVASRLGRDAVLIELNEAYAVMARNRIVADAPLFAEVAD